MAMSMQAITTGNLRDENIGKTTTPEISARFVSSTLMLAVSYIARSDESPKIFLRDANCFCHGRKNLKFKRQS